MKVLFVFSAPAGGMYTLNVERNLALTEKGIECHFLYFKNPSHNHLNGHCHHYLTNKDEEVRELLQKNLYHAVIVCTDYSFLERIRNIGFQGKLVYEIQGLGNYQSTINWLEKSQSYVAKYADAVLYPKTKFLDTLIKKYYINKKMFSFHNCIDTTRFTWIEVPKPNETIIGWVGRLDKNKNWREFLLIGAALLKDIPNLKLWLFHDPAFCSRTEKKVFSRWIKKLDLTESLVVYEKVPRNKMPLYYSMIAKSGGLLCSTSILEGFGYAVIEAMSCKCPVLATKSGGVESFVFHDYTGKLYDQGDINSGIFEAKDLMTNLDLKEKIIQEANRLINTSFTSQEYARNFAEMLIDISN